MCFKWLVYCNCCKDFIYMHTFKHCGVDMCTLVYNDILPQSYCNLCIGNGCRNSLEKCVSKDLVLQFNTIKTPFEMNFNRGGNIKGRKI
jgi:hypothetical protein